MSLRHLLLALVLCSPLSTFALSADSIGAPKPKKRLRVEAGIELRSDSAIFQTPAQAGEPQSSGFTLDIGISRLKLMGYAQTQIDATHTHGQKTDFSFNMTRLVLMADAQLTRHLSFFLMADLAATRSDRYLHEYYAQYEYLPRQRVRIGQMKVPYTLESLLPPPLLGAVNLNESTRYFAGIAGDPAWGNKVGRDIGILLTGELLPRRDGHCLLGYSIGVFNGSGLNQKDHNTQKDVAAMLTVSPIKGLTLQTSMWLGTTKAIADGPYGNILANRNYHRRRYSAGLELQHAPWRLRTEAMWGSDNGVHSRGFYAEAWYRLWKNLDVVADFDYLDKNTSLHKSQQRTYQNFTETCNYLIGLQYWVWKACRVSVQYVYSDRLAGPNVSQWLTQFQVAF